MLYTYLLAGGAIILSALMLYLASRHQKLLSKALPRKTLGTAGSVLALASLVLLRQVSGPAVSVFILMTGLMLLWTLVPLAIAYNRARREQG